MPLCAKRLVPDPLQEKCPSLTQILLECSFVVAAAAAAPGSSEETQLLQLQLWGFYIMDIFVWPLWQQRGRVYMMSLLNKNPFISILPHYQQMF